MFDTFINFISKPDSWFVLFGVAWAVAVGGSRFLAKKFGWHIRISLKPTAPANTGPSQTDNLIDRELKDWKSKYLTLEALLEVSRSQWSEKIDELTLENSRLRTGAGADTGEPTIETDGKEKEKEKEKNNGGN